MCSLAVSVPIPSSVSLCLDIASSAPIRSDVEAKKGAKQYFFKTMDIGLSWCHFHVKLKPVTLISGG